MSAAELAWLIPGATIAAFLIIAFVTHPYPRLSGYVTIAGVALAGIISLVIFPSAAQAGIEHPLLSKIPWLAVGHRELHMGVLLDPLTATMLIVVTAVSLLVQIYSQAYMHGDPGYSRYFAFMALFTTSMLGLVLADNLAMLFVFWELVGLCSYLLIGFWYHKPEAAAAAKKAFITTRLGDLGLLIAILFLWNYYGTLEFTELNEMAVLGKLAGPALTFAALGIFAGAVGKSAQFPLHVWLPDAMEGPTPVSALIHAATMVAAGVYLVGRTFPMFHASPDASNVVAIIGATTAIVAATMGLVMFDIKRVMAYSTVSQLGYMMMGLGVGGFVAGIFHLFNHAFFKALLFLGSGSVIHGTGTQDMREMGGLRRYMPITFITLTIASLSLAGIPPFSGFFSKDEILADALHNGRTGVFVVGLVAAFMTAFYSFRMIFLTFTGEYRGGPKEVAAHVAAPSGHDHSSGDEDETLHAHGAGHDAPAHASHGHSAPGQPHESPAAMAIPLILLAIPAVLTGFLNLNGGFTSFLLGAEEGAREFHGIDPTVAIASVVVALAGILLATMIYGLHWFSPEVFSRPFRPLYALFFNKYYLDELYENVIVRRVVIGVFELAAWFDRTVVDGIVNAVAWLTVKVGAGLRYAETGRVQAYALVAASGLVIVVAGFMLFQR